MAPRRQAKQAAAESIAAAAAADNVTPPPKKRKTVATEEPRPTKGRNRQAKAGKQENVEEVAAGPASPPKKPRGKQKNASPSAVAKNDTKSRSKKRVNREPEDTAVESDHAGEKVAVKRARGAKAVATVAKKAGTKTAATKSKAKSPAARKQKIRATDEDGAGDSKKKNAVGGSPVKKARRMKAVEEDDVPAQPAAKVARKRKNVEEAITVAQATEEEEQEEKVASKKPRGKAKKVETNDAPMTSKGRSKKNPAKKVAKPLPEEAEIKKQNSKKQNAEIQENNLKTKSVKNVKKGNGKKAAPRGKFNAAAGKADEAQAEEAATPEVDVKENGEAHVAELKQKKGKAGKTNAAMNGKVEAKGKQKKKQAIAASVEEKEATKDITVENETTEMSVASEIDDNDTKDISLSKDDSILLNEEEKNEISENKADSLKDESNPEISIKETEKSGSFLCF